MPTVIEPLREEWDNVYATAVTQYEANKVADARKTVRDFREKLCHLHILDPACGSGNFLYVTLELLKRLEGEVTRAMIDFGEQQKTLGVTIGPEQFLGIEVNPRAAAIADLVLWIGYLQWHIRALGKETIAEPIIRRIKNIECRDAVLAWNSIEPVVDEDGNPVTRWDGHTTKRHPVTGEEVPDETAKVQELRYITPKKAEWPQADYIVGNPPFVSNREMRSYLGDGYVEAINTAYSLYRAPVDFVMIFWDRAAGQVMEHGTAAFGFITTNSIRSQQNNTVVVDWIARSLCLTFAIPDHPWISESGSAKVRVSFTVSRNKEFVDSNVRARLRIAPGHDHVATGEGRNEILTDSVFTELRVRTIPPDLSPSVDISTAGALKAWDNLVHSGMKPYAESLVISESKAQELFPNVEDLVIHAPRYFNGKDVAGTWRQVRVLDFFGFDEDTLRASNPLVYQYLYDYVRSERAGDRDPNVRDRWWLFQRNRPELRRGLRGLKRFIATVENSPVRYFVFLPTDCLPDQKLRVIASDDPTVFGVLSSRVQALFSRRFGGRQGVANTPVFNSRCATHFPLPAPENPACLKIADLAEQIDSHRTRQQELYPGLAMTGMYNVLEKLRSGEELTAKEKAIHEKGLVSVLKQIHDDLDAAVFDAYGWPHDLTDEEILERLVALNHERAEEEKRGIIRWLRPEFQNPTGGKTAVQSELELEGDSDEEDSAEETSAKGKKEKKTTTTAAATKATKTPWPKTLPQQVAAVRQMLQQQTAPSTSTAIAKQFKAAKANTVEELLETLVAIGQARILPDGRYAT